MLEQPPTLTNSTMNNIANINHLVYLYLNRWRVCGIVCWIYIALDIVALSQHLLMCMKSLNMWANYNFALIFQSIYTFYISAASLMLLVGEPNWMLAPYYIRLIAFMASLMTTTVFSGHAVGLGAKMYSTYKKEKEQSLGSILSLYTLIIEFGAFVPALYIFLYEGLAFN